ncbi:MAG: ankyrin repeat domain-containing protein [Lachnospiraceae bacterium]|nr:ankyrin repeat domain-containing protein [Lachnospiraceae bacterium]
MKKLFVAIRQGKLDEVARILDKNPDLIACLAKAPPKKDDGQSPLMVAIKSDNLEVAHLLLDRGADVNFRDAINPYGSNFSAPIWYDAIGQCFMRARNIVGPGPERSKGYFLLLRRLLDMGMDPNQTTLPGGRSAWQHAVDQYDEFARGSYPSYYVEESKTENRQLREMLKAVLDELLAHGADIHAFVPPKEGLPASSVILRNMKEGRELLDGLSGLDPDSDVFKPHTVKYRGKEQVITPSLTVEDYRQRYENKWRELEPILRDYYEKAR